MKGTVKNLMMIVFTVVFAVGVHFLLRFILVDDVDSYTRVQMHELHHPAENIDVLFVGSSHCYRSIDPVVTDEGFGAYTFNGGSGSQPMDASLAMVREAAALNRLEKVFVEVYFGVAQTESNASRKALTSIWIISDYMYPLPAKASFILNASGPQYYVQSFLPERRNWKNLIRPSRIMEICGKKLTSSYMTYAVPRPELQGDGSVEQYMYRGYVGHTGVLGQGERWIPSDRRKIDPQGISGDYIKSLRAIVAECRKENARCVFFAAPVTDDLTASFTGYDEYRDFISGIAAEEGAEFVDFNVCRPEYFDCGDRQYFKDHDHLNSKGAEKFSRLISDWAMDRLSGDAVWYDSFEDKMADLEPAIYGACREETQDGADTVSCTVVTDRSIYEGRYKDEVSDIRVFFTPDDAEQMRVDTGDGTGGFILPAAAKGTVRIEGVLPGGENVVTPLEFRYNTVD